MSRFGGTLAVLTVLVAVVIACRLDTKMLSIPFASPDQPERTLATSIQLAPAQTTPIDRADAWEDVWQTLERRPLRLPRLASANLCSITPFEPVYGDMKGVGDGPVYLMTDPHNPGVALYNAAPDKDGRHASKVLWIGDPIYRGPALIRGQQLDGPDIVHFRGDDGSPTREELRFAMWTGVSSADFPPEWRERPSEVSFALPGCYAFQVDGENFSRAIALRAMPSP